MHLSIPTNEAIFTEASLHWAPPTMRLEDALDQELVPIELQGIKPSASKGRISAVRMYVARWIGEYMRANAVSDGEMGDVIRSHAEIYQLCEFIGETKLGAHWIQTQAPLFVGDDIQIKWERLRRVPRYPLIPSVAWAIATGVVKNNTGTDFYTFCLPLKQLLAFAAYCEGVAAGRSANEVDSEVRKNYGKDFTA